MHRGIMLHFLFVYHDMFDLIATATLLQTPKTHLQFNIIDIMMLNVVWNEWIL